MDGHHFRRQEPIGPYTMDFVCVAFATHRQPGVDGGSAYGRQVTRNGHDG
ncbi:MAG: DUF559 domain-containing protein [Alphaproteobacteria bacterium]|nr:DUF559 domain-containing protein [Alphaproteobacteria bacterium]